MNKSSTQNNSNEIPEFFLTFGMKNYDKNKGNEYTGCPLDNNKISNGYIKAEGKMSYSLDNSDDRKYKCFTLHPIIENKDITPYTYGYIGYDLNADSMKIYAGGWDDLRSNNNGNKIIENINTLDTDGKKGHLYLDKDSQVHIKMLDKVIQRAKLLKQYADHYNTSNNNGSIFENNSCDTSFTSDNYDIKVYKSASTNNRFIIKQKELNEQSNNELQDFYKKYGLSPYECFELTYNKNNNEFTLHSNELNGVPKDANKGIKVDRIFVKKSILDINSWYWIHHCPDKSSRLPLYDNYMKNIADVLVENFPNGDIRIIDGQNFKIIKTEDFIQTYIQNAKEKNFYLSELEKKRKSIQQNKEGQITTSKYQEDISSHTLHNKEIISMAQTEQAVDNQYKNDLLHIYMTGQNTASNNGNFLSTVNHQTTQMSKTIINPAGNPDTNENNINNNDSDWHLCSCWKQCWDRCC